IPTMPIFMASPRTNRVQSYAPAATTVPAFRTASNEPAIPRKGFGSRAFWTSGDRAGSAGTKEASMSENVDPRAGQLPTPKDLVDVPKLIEAYYDRKPDPAVASQRVAFGTSGHRGSAFDTAFNEDHILAITQAICDYRRAKDVDGPLFVGR